MHHLAHNLTSLLIFTPVWEELIQIIWFPLPQCYIMLTLPSTQQLLTRGANLSNVYTFMHRDTCQYSPCIMVASRSLEKEGMGCRSHWDLVLLCSRPTINHLKCSSGSHSNWTPPHPSITSLHPISCVIMSLCWKKIREDKSPLLLHWTLSFNTISFQSCSCLSSFLIL